MSSAGRGRGRSGAVRAVSAGRGRGGGQVDNYKVVLLGEGLASTPGVPESMSGLLAFPSSDLCTAESSELSSMPPMITSLPRLRPCAGRVGKTSLIRRYVDDKFNDREAPTVPTPAVQESLYTNRRVNIGDRVDTAGQERFHVLGPLYYRQAKGALLVFDITERETFERVQVWIRELQKQGMGDIALVVAGNKCDLRSQRQVDDDEAQRYCRSVGARFILTSAKMNINADGQRPGGVLRIDDEPENRLANAREKEKKCCS